MTSFPLLPAISTVTCCCSGRPRCSGNWTSYIIILIIAPLLGWVHVFSLVTKHNIFLIVHCYAGTKVWGSIRSVDLSHLSVCRFTQERLNRFWPNFTRVSVLVWTLTRMSSIMRQAFMWQRLVHVGILIYMKDIFAFSVFDSSRLHVVGVKQLE
jgi:hypothetical protein